ncbi:MAG: tetratricopeptide repeat protein, partial [Bryobacteraceae bacterium]
LFLEQDKLAEAEALYRDALLGLHEGRLYADAVRGLALVLHGEKKNADAGKTIVEWMSLRGQKLPAADPERLPVTMAAAEIRLEAAEYSEAESKFREVLAAGDKLGNGQRSAAQKELADSLFGQHKCQAAEELYKSVLPSLPDQPAAQSWEKLAACYTAQRQGQKSVEAWQEALKLANKPGFPEAERQRIRLTMVDVSLETGAVDQARLEEWVKAHANQRSRLTADETSILEKTARTLKAKEQYAMAETVFGMLLDESIGAAPGAIEMNPTLTDYAEVSAKQNKNAQAAAVYERLAMRTQAVRLSDSEKYLVEAEKLREKDGKPVELAAAMQALGDTYAQENKYSEARPWFEKAGEALKQNGGGESPNYAAALNGLGRVAQAERKFDQAESLYEQAYNLLTKAPDPPRTIMASVLFNRGNLKLSNGKTVEANADFDLCLKLSQGDFTRENPPPVAEFDRIAAFYADQNWYDKAEARYQSNLTLRRNIFGENSTEAGWGWYQLATFYNSTKAYGKAADDAERAWHIFEASAGRESDEVSMTLSVLSKAYHMQGKGEQAIDAAERSLAIQTKLGRPQEELTQTLSSLGELLMCPCAEKPYLAPLPGNHDRKDFDKALKVYQRMADLWNAEAFNDLNYRRAVRNIVIAYVYVKDFNNAKKWYRQLSSKLKDPDQLKTAAEAYAYALQANGQAKEAAKVSPPKGG